MSCDKWKEKLSAFTDSELTSNEQKGLEKHLENCESCKEEYLKLKDVRDDIRIWEDEGVSDDFETRLWEKIWTSMIADSTKYQVRSRRILSFRRIAIAASVIVIMSAALIFYYHYKQEKWEKLTGRVNKTVSSNATIRLPQKSLWAINIPGYHIHGQSSKKINPSYKSIWNYSDRINENMYKKFNIERKEL